MFQETYSIWVYLILDSQEMIVQKTKKLPKKSAAFGGRLLVLFWGLKYNHFLGVQNKYTHIEYISWNIFLFEVQLCIQKSSFNEFCGILIIWQIGCRVARYNFIYNPLTSIGLGRALLYHCHRI